jgi:four helix bundle protein
MKDRDSGFGIGDSHQRPHERLDVWRDAMDLAEEIYRFSARLPEQERFGLTAQMRRTAVSVPSNIAEGAARRSKIEYLRFLSIARGSLSELDTQVKLVLRLQLVAESPAVSQIDRVFAKLNALIRALSRPANMDGSAFESRIPNPESHAR